MKITIDTKEDSFEDIQRMIHVLTNIMEKKGHELKPTAPVADTTNMMSMFDNSKPAAETQASDEGTAPDFSSFLNLTKNTENKDDDEPKVQVF